MSTLVKEDCIWNANGDCTSIISYLQTHHSSVVDLYELERVKLIIELLQSLRLFKFNGLTRELSQLLASKTSQQLRNAIIKLATYQVEDGLMKCARVEYCGGCLGVLNAVLGW